MSKPMISVVINADTRKENYNMDGMGNGCVSRDFLVDGVKNKIKFFEGFDCEFIIFIDKHEELTFTQVNELEKICDTVVIRKHTDEPKFNDYNYLSALSMARGEIICHCDQDTNLFTSGPEPVQQMIRLLDKYDYVSYPSAWSPNPVHDDSFDYKWCSTRFFMCKWGTIDTTEIARCLKDSEYLYKLYPASRECPWTEHILGLIAKYTGKGAFYPPIDLATHSIFSWGRYHKGLLAKLNSMPYDDVRQYIDRCGGPVYPNDIAAIEI